MKFFLQELRKDADQACRYIGFLRSVVVNEIVPQKLNGSYSGYAAQTAISATENSVILYCARAWDGAIDAISVRRAINGIPPAERLNVRSRERLEALGSGYSVKPLDEAYHKAINAYGILDRHPNHPTLRLLRTEHFAHRIVQSHERDRYARQNVDIPDLNYNDLLEIAEGTVILVGQIGYLWEQLANPYPDRIAHCEEYSREFWNVLPTLKEVERR